MKRLRTLLFHLFRGPPLVIRPVGGRPLALQWYCRHCSAFLHYNRFGRMGDCDPVLRWGPKW